MAFMYRFFRTFYGSIRGRAHPLRAPISEIMNACELEDHLHIIRILSSNHAWLRPNQPWLRKSKK